MARRRQPIQTRLAKRLRALRVEHELSQMDMVREYGFSLSHYQRMERGVLDPRLTTLEKLADAFGTTVCELLAGV